MKRIPDNGVTMAIVPTGRGLAYIVFENPDLPMDWGVKDVRVNKLRDSFEKARVLMHMLQPSVLILEEIDDKSSRRSKWVQLLVGKLAQLGEEKGMKVVWVSRTEVRATFAKLGAYKKYDIARAVARLVPELASRLPPRRTTGGSEHYSMGIFEAAALAITHFTGGVLKHLHQRGGDQRAPLGGRPRERVYIQKAASDRRKRSIAVGRSSVSGAPLTP